jgi:hypothetical protein
VFSRKEMVEVERLWRPALLTLDQSGAKRSQPGLVFFEETQAGANDLACGTVAAFGNLPVNEASEMIAQGDGGVFGHDGLLTL